MKVLLVYPNLQMVNLIPTNIGILSSILKQNNITVKLFDTTFYKTKNKSEDEIRVEYGHYKSAYTKYKNSDVFNDFTKLVNEYNPDIIAFSIVDATWPLANELINKININCHVICGGVLPMFAPDIVFKNNKVNSVCIGEGEDALLELCNKISNNLDITKIQNLWIKKDGVIHKNTLRRLVDINTLPYEDFSIFEPERFYRPMQGKLKKMLPLMIDRGCPYTCSFCAEPQIHKLYKSNNLCSNFRVKDLDTTYKYIEYMVDAYNPDYIYFNSETFFARPEQHIREFSKFYMKNIKLPFCCMTRIETVTETRMELLKNMGCDRISFGIEHGNEEFRKTMLKKPFTNDQIYNAIKIMNYTKIPSTFFNMIGFPDETPSLAMETIELNKWINNNYLGEKSFSVSIFQPYYSTPLRDYCIDKKYIDTDTQPTSLIYDSVLKMPNFPQEKIIELTKNFVTLINA